MSRLGSTFFERETTVVAQALLGQLLVSEVGGQRTSGVIVETEAYTGWDDLASHGRAGKTPRNLPMFGPVGVSYVYLCYGMYWLLNLVARPAEADYPAAVLIRALEPREGQPAMAERRAGRSGRDLARGPGRLTQALGVTGIHNQLDVTAPDSPIYLMPAEPPSPGAITAGPRIGINAAEPWLSIPWRFWVAGSPYVSK